MKPEVDPRSLGEILVTSGEPDDAMKPPAHGKSYKISMTVLIFLGTWGVVIALIYWVSLYDDRGTLGSLIRGVLGWTS